MDSYWADKLFEFSGNFILPNVVAEAMGANWDQTYRWSPDKPNDIIKSDMIFDDDIEMTSEEIKLFLVSLQIFTATIVDTILDPVDQQRYWKDVRGVEKEPISSEGVI